MPGAGCHERAPAALRGHAAAVAAAELAADQRAKIMLVEGGEISADHVEEVLRLLMKSQPQQQRFGVNPVGKNFSVGGCLGAAAFHTAHLKKHHFCWERTSFVAKLLNKFRDAALGIVNDVDDRVMPTTIQVNLNFDGRLHVDGNNVGPSDIMSPSAAYKGGEFFIEDHQGDTERELVSTFSSKRGGRRTPGIYRGRLVDVQRKWHHFDGAISLHRAEPTIAGERFTLVWFSLSPSWVRRMSPETVDSLRSSGFRPRYSEEPVPKQPVVDRRSDWRSYPPGFLYFARAHRADVEKELGSCEATRVLRKRFESLGCGECKGEAGYFAGLERCERGRFKYIKKGAQDMHEDENDKTESDAIDVDSDSDAVAEDSAVEGCINMETLTELIETQFPSALQSPDLFISVLEDLGVAQDVEVRAKAYHILEARKIMAGDAALARRLNSAREEEHQDCIVVEDSSPRAKRRRFFYGLKPPPSACVSLEVDERPLGRVVGAALLPETMPLGVACGASNTVRTCDGEAGMMVGGRWIDIRADAQALVSAGLTRCVRAARDALVAAEGNVDRAAHAFLLAGGD